MSDHGIGGAVVLIGIPIVLMFIGALVGFGLGYWVGS